MISPFNQYPSSRPVGFAASIVFIAAAALAGAPIREPDCDGKRKQFEAAFEKQAWSLVQHYVHDYQKCQNLSRLKAAVDTPRTTAARERLTRIANRIARAAGRGDFAHPVIIVESDEFNARADMDGTITFYTGMLDAFEAEARTLAQEKTSANKSLGPAAFDLHLDSLIAGVMGHELGHVYQNHYKSYFAAVRSGPAASTDRTALLYKVRFKQDLELKADRFSFEILSRAGYDSDYVLRGLVVFHRVNEGRKARAGELAGGSNPYLDSHPSPNERLARLGGEKKELYERLARLEKAFAAIDTGIDLLPAMRTIKAELGADSANPYLLAARAKLHHRLWEKSCHVEELIFKISITPVPFREAMLHPDKRRKAMVRICGVEAHYRDAVDFYGRALAENPTDLDTQSTMAALLAYDEAQRSKALELSHAAVTSLAARLETYRGSVSDTPAADLRERFLEHMSSLTFPMIRTANNHAIVLYFAEQTGEAEKYFQLAYGRLTKLPESLTPNATALQALSRYNTGSLREAAFNLGKFHQLSGNREAMQGAWLEYVESYDSTSQWARYAAQQIRYNLGTGIEKDLPRVGPVAVGMKSRTLGSLKLGPHRVVELAEGDRKFIYDEIGLTVHLRRLEDETLIVSAVQLDRAAKGSPPSLSNGIRLGMRRDQIEKAIRGSAPRLRAAVNGAQVYYPTVNVSVTYDRVAGHQVANSIRVEQRY